jgi:hypothetical protein
MTPEAKVKAKVKAIFHAHDVYFVMPMGTGYGKSGVPDFLACCCGKFIAVETKAGKGKTTALQERELSFIREAGGIALVINEGNLHELENIIKYIIFANAAKRVS